VKEKENGLISDLGERDAKGTKMHTFLVNNNIDTDSKSTLKEKKDPYRI